MTLPPQLGDLTIIRSTDEGKTLCVCRRGHEQWRQTHSLANAARKGTYSLCYMCGPALTELQLKVLAAVAAFGEVVGCGPTYSEVSRFFRKKVDSTLQQLQGRGLIRIDEWREWRLTDDGWAEIEWTEPCSSEQRAAE